MKTLTAASLACATCAFLALGTSGALAQDSRAPMPTAAPAQHRAPPPQGAIVPRPALAASLKALDASLAEARRIGISVTCVVVDVRGDLVALERMDDASFFTASLAQGKALGSVLFGLPSAALGPLASSPLFASIDASVGNRMVPAQGAFPIMRRSDHRLIGAIGCSGGSPPQDGAAAKAGLATF